MTRQERFKASCRRYLQILETAKPLEKEKRALKEFIDDYTGGENIVDGKYIVNYNPVRGGIDLEALLADHPEIDIERYRKPSSTRIQVKIEEA